MYSTISDNCRNGIHIYCNKGGLRYGGARASFLSIKFVAKCTQMYIPVTVYVQSTNMRSVIKNSEVIVYIPYNHCLKSKIAARFTIFK